MCCFVSPCCCKSYMTPPSIMYGCGIPMYSMPPIACNSSFGAGFGWGIGVGLGNMIGVGLGCLFSRWC